MYEAMESVEKIRILVGLNVDKYTVKIIGKANMELAYDSPTTKQAKEAFGDSVEDEFEKAEPTLQIEQGVRSFVDLLNDSQDAEMEDELDRLVYKIYGLDEKEQRIVEEKYI